MDYSFFDFLRLIGSLALFLYGMKILSEGLPKFAGEMCIRDRCGFEKLVIIIVLFIFPKVNLEKTEDVS